jgi:hypothetical protein
MTDTHLASSEFGVKDTPKVKKRKPIPKEFPIRLNLNITPAMAESLGRLHTRLRLKEATIGRLAIMHYLAANDPHYRET